MVIPATPDADGEQVGGLGPELPEDPSERPPADGEDLDDLVGVQVGVRCGAALYGLEDVAPPEDGLTGERVHRPDCRGDLRRDLLRVTGEDCGGLLGREERVGGELAANPDAAEVVGARVDAGERARRRPPLRVVFRHQSGTVKLQRSSKKASSLPWVMRADGVPK